MSTPSQPGSGAVSPSGRSSKRRANNDLLRNYYGLSGGQSSPATPPLSASSLMPGQSALSASGSSAVDPDGSNFDASAAFRQSLQQKSLAQLLKEESDLLTEIRELDGERQSLVYNHHHELVSASETMRKMKEQADTLIPSLTLLQTSLQSISSTSESLSMPLPFDSVQSVQRQEVLMKAKPVIELPQRLRDLILLEEDKSGLAKAQGLWGTMESVLASWDEAGVQGAKEIMHDCRLVLREAQQHSVHA